MRNHLISLLSIVLLTIGIGAEISAQDFEVKLKELKHACNGSGGAIVYEIVGTAAGHTFVWSNGNLGLKNENLVPGEYTLFVDPENPCERQELKALIKDRSNPNATLTVTNQTCITDVKLNLFNNGLPIGPEGFKIKWADNIQNTLNRSIQRGSIASLCVEVTMNTDSACAFSQTLCATVGSAQAGCQGNNIGFPKILVNEFSKRNTTIGQYIELLVVGDGVCGNTTDIRGFLINHVRRPDQDTAASVAGSYVSGFLKFSNDVNWEHVPNGSLIVIYDEDHKHGYIAADDPYDTDHNYVYILKANDAALLEGRLESVLVPDSTYYSGGLYTSPKWELLKMNSGLEGMYTRYPDGSLSHGYSTDPADVVATAVLPFELVNQTEDTCSCAILDSNYVQVVSYGCVNLFPTPGFANSYGNSKLIARLQTCGQPPAGNAALIMNPGEGASTAGHSERRKMELYPNPASNYFTVKITSATLEEAFMDIINGTGAVVYRRDITLEPGSNEIVQMITDRMYPGIYFVMCRYADGGFEVKPITIIQ